jgi:ATP-binding cassette, subfamily C (CFTR/MRP), member 1
MFANTLASTISTFVLICYATPLFIVALVPLMSLYYFMQLVYRATSRELKRLDSISRSPLYANFGETLIGLPTIRAYREQSRFIANNDRTTNQNSTPYFLLVTATRWIALRLEVLGALLVFFAATFGILASNSLNPALLGLSLSYALQVT